GLRGRRRPAPALVVLLGILAAGVLTAVAASRRTATAYDRLVAFTRQPDAFAADTIAIGERSSHGQNGSGAIDLRAIARLPQVVDSVVGRVLVGSVTRSDGSLPLGNDVNLATTGGPIAGHFLFHSKVLAGRLPRAASIHEVAVGYRSHQTLEVGDRLVVTLLKRSISPLSVDLTKLEPPQIAAKVPVRVVGLV